MFSIAQVRFQDKRMFPRRNCRWPGLLKTGNSHRPCVVDDIGAGGCRLVVKIKELQLDERVVVEVASKQLRFHGEIAWMRGDEVGIQFLFMD